MSYRRDKNLIDVLSIANCFAIDNKLSEAFNAAEYGNRRRYFTRIDGILRSLYVSGNFSSARVYIHILRSFFEHAACSSERKG